MIIALGQRLNIELVAEGVETEEQARYLRRHGVPVLQGFFYARPMPLRDFRNGWREVLPASAS
jgi:sensor c-di-GMP phosphodiesterase-like protein